MRERTTDFKNSQGGGTEPLGSRLDHCWQEKALDVAFHQDDCVGEEEVAVRQLQIPLQKFSRWSVGRVHLEKGQIPHVRVMVQLVADAAKVPDGREPALIENVRGMRSDDDLRVEERRVIAGILKQAQHVPDEDLLNLRVQMRLRLFNEDQMQRRPLVLLGLPLLV